MSPLREEIQAARREYMAIRYPGGLSAELLPFRLRWRSLLAFSSLSFGGIAAAAVVAALMIAPLLAPPASHSTSSLPLIDRLPLARDLKSDLLPLDPLPEELKSLVPSSPSDLHVPTWDDLHLPNFSESPEHA